MNANLKSTVEVQVASSQNGIPQESEFESWALAAMKALDANAQLCVRIVDETEGTALNETYRGRSGPTNVLSFSFDATQCTEPPLLGDVIICAPVVESEAQSQSKSATAHYAHMVVHGTLHLLGHDHETESEAARMEALECDIITDLGFADPYATTAAQ